MTIFAIFPPSPWARSPLRRTAYEEEDNVALRSSPRATHGNDIAFWSSDIYLADRDGSGEARLTHMNAAHQDFQPVH
jgi:hypothetical protein